LRERTRWTSTRRPFGSRKLITDANRGLPRYSRFRPLKRRQRALSTPKCHKLHFLQMACEKLAKAHLCNGRSDPLKLQASHAHVRKTLPRIARQFLSEWQRRQVPRGSYPLPQIRHLSRQIELLSPSVDDDGKCPENCEYPWEVGRDELRIPADYEFPKLSLLTEEAGRTLLKVIHEAIARST
jgi:hypothetical protein